MELVFVISFGYLIGSIPFGFLYSKYLAGIDVRGIGSNSTGSTNVLRTGHKKLAFLTLLSDILKGALVTYLTGLFCSLNEVLISSFCCLVGHVFPVWLKFKGGKGAASAAGTFLVLSSGIALASAIVWILTAKFLKISSLASLFFCASFCLLLSLSASSSEINLPVVIYSWIVLGLLLFTHRSNIGRLLKGEEFKV